ncbi:MAG TPA: translation initiation factor IF-2 associated domain-containing protein, partial [Xanthobacteraceae bacterium]|nr:translation initiation factor IF-2 associated domain-containing protein [Xanthobacteraceae bacterium]
MTDTKNPGEKLTVAPSKPTLTLGKRSGVEQGVVRQSFSHGRTKSVVVEKVKRRIGPAETKPVEAAPAPATTRRATTAPPATPAPTPAPIPATKPSGVVLRTLTEDERSARAHALADSRVREAEERKIAEEEARRRVERETVSKVERDAAEARKREEEERHRHDEEAKKKAEQEAKKRFGGEETTARPAAATPVSSRANAVQEADEEEAPRPRRGPGGGVARPAPPPRPARTGTAEKRRGRLTLVTALNADEVRERSVASFRRRTQRMSGHRDNEPKEKLVRDVTIPETITIQELANRMAERSVDVIKLLMK